MRGRILLVEDDWEIQDLLGEALDDEGFDVTCFASPDALLQDLWSHRPDLFLVDLMLPRISGIELAARLRQLGFTQTPILGMSASKPMATVAHGSGVFDHVIDKPFDLDTLIATLEHYGRGSVYAD